MSKPTTKTTTTRSIVPVSTALGKAVCAGSSNSRNASSGDLAAVDPAAARIYRAILLADVGPNRISLVHAPLSLPRRGDLAAVFALVKISGEKLLAALSGDPGSSVAFRLAMTEPLLCPVALVGTILPPSVSKSIDSRLVAIEFDKLIVAIESGAHSSHGASPERPN